MSFYWLSFPEFSPFFFFCLGIVCSRLNQLASLWDIIIIIVWIDFAVYSLIIFTTVVLSFFHANSVDQGFQQVLQIY